MAYLSKTCAKTHLPVMAKMAGIPELSEVVALLPNGNRFVGSYDGYGRINGHNLNELGEFEEAKFVLKKFWRNETFEDLGPSHSDPGQGWFHDDNLLKQWLAQGGFKSFKDYEACFFAEESTSLNPILVCHLPIVQKCLCTANQIWSSCH